MVLPVSECIEHIKDTLGGARSAPTVGYYRIMNGAGEYLMSCHHWAWAQGGQQTISFEGGHNHVYLPRDFRDLIAIEATQGLTSGLTLTTLQGIVDLRTKSLTTTSTQRWGAITYNPRYEYASGTVTFTDVPGDEATLTLDDGLNPAVVFEFDTDGDGAATGNVEVDTSASTTEEEAAALFQSAVVDVVQSSSLELTATVSGAVVTITSRVSGSEGNINVAAGGSTPANFTSTGLQGGREGGRPEARLEIWPTPTTDEVGALTLYYRRGWKALHQDSNEVSIPEWLEETYLLLVRARARGYVREDIGDMNLRIAQVKAGPDMQAALSRDAEIQPEFGMLEGGAAQGVMDPSSWPFNFTGTSAPA